jgi:hypothetical protein
MSAFDPKRTLQTRPYLTKQTFSMLAGSSLFGATHGC